MFFQVNYTFHIVGYLRIFNNFIYGNFFYLIWFIYLKNEMKARSEEVFDFDFDWANWDADPKTGLTGVHELSSPTRSFSTLFLKINKNIISMSANHVLVASSSSAGWMRVKIILLWVLLSTTSSPLFETCIIYSVGPPLAVKSPTCDTFCN